MKSGVLLDTVAQRWKMDSEVSFHQKSYVSKQRVVVWEEGHKPPVDGMWKVSEGVLIQP